MINRNIEICKCCGWAVYTSWKTSGGHMHPRCWDDHHSDPAGPWPPDHECRKP